MRMTEAGDGTVLQTRMHLYEFWEGKEVEGNSWLEVGKCGGMRGWCIGAHIFDTSALMA